MSRELKFPTGGRDGDGRDEELAPLLRSLYAAPADEAYWDGLQARVMRRVQTGAEEGAWWMVLSHWTRAGAAAAVLLAAMAGALLLQQRSAQARLAYEAVLSQSPVYSLRMATEEPDAPASNPTLRYGVP